MITTLLAWALALTVAPAPGAEPPDSAPQAMVPARRLDPEAQAPPLAVAPDPAAGHRPVLRIGGALDDPALEEAARSGLPLRVRVRVELWRDRFFDELVGSEIWSAVLLYEPLEARFLLRARASPEETRAFSSFDAARAALERGYESALRPTRAGRYYYIAALEVQTLSLSDLEELEQWLKGELGPAVSGEGSLPGAVGAGAKRLLVRMLGLPARRHEARSGRFRVP